jgi:O-antigen/teichoic acid export membrane protein
MFKKYFSGSEFSKNVITLVTGTGLAQLISFLSAPILSRLFTPADFSICALFTSASAIISVIAAARFEVAIPLPEKKSDAINLFALSIRIILFVSVATLMGVLVYNFLPAKIKSPLFNAWFFLLPLSVLCSGVYSACNFFSTRNKTFFRNASGRVVAALATAIVSLLLGYLMWGGTGLIIGYFAGQAAGTALMFTDIYKNIFPDRDVINKTEMRKVAGKYKNFARYNTPHALIDSIQDNGVVFILATYFSQTVVGLYSYAFRILKAPVGLIGSALNQIYYQQMSDMHNKGEDLRKTILNIYKKLFIISFPGFLILFLFTPQIFSFVFGQKWHDAGVIAQILTPWLFLNFLISPVSSITLIKHKQKEAFGITIIDICARFSALIYSGITGNYILGFTIVSASCSAIMIFALFWYYSLGKPNGK